MHGYNTSIIEVHYEITVIEGMKFILNYEQRPKHARTVCIVSCVVIRRVQEVSSSSLTINDSLYRFLLMVFCLSRIDL